MSNPQFVPQGGNAPQNYFQQPFQNLVKNPMATEFLTGVITNDSRFQRIQAFSLKDFVFTPEMKGYFNVNNEYVLKKLKMIFFPFISQVSEDSNAPQSHDYFHDHDARSQKKPLGSPDLYLPSIAIMTFTLMMCFTRGMGDNFEPDLIGYYLTNCLVACLMEIFIYKIVLILVHIKTLSMWDLVALVNYKYVPLCLIMVLNLVLSSWFIVLFKLYVSLAIVVFMYNILKAHSQNTPTTASIGSHIVPVQNILYVLSGLQFLTIWVVLKLLG
jgi:hypothetical protein